MSIKKYCKTRCAIKNYICCYFCPNRYDKKCISGSCINKVECKHRKSSIELIAEIIGN